MVPVYQQPFGNRDAPTPDTAASEASRVPTLQLSAALSKSERDPTLVLPQP